MAKKCLILIAGLILLTLLGIVKGVTTNTSGKGAPPSNLSTELQNEIPSDWKSYQSSGLQLSLRYPPTYTVTETDETLVIQHDSNLVPNITIHRSKGLPAEVWGPQALETHREARKDPSAPSFIVTTFSTGDPSTVRRYILFPKRYPESPADTGEDAEGLLIDMLGGDTHDPKDNLTATLEKVIFSLQDLR